MFDFQLVDADKIISPVAPSVANRDQALAVAKRLAIELAETQPECRGVGLSVSVVDDAGNEVHRESVDSAYKSG